MRIDEGVTDAVGNGVLRHAGQDALLLDVWAGGHVGKAVDVDARREATRVQLASLGGIEGEVVDGSGAPLPAAVSLELSPGASVGALHMLAEERPAGKLLLARADSRGAFRFDGLPPAAAYGLQATAEGWSRAVRSVDVPAGGTARVRLRLERAGGLRGRVLSRTGEPLPGARIRLYRAENEGWHQERAARTGDEGRFELTEVETGRYLVQAEHRGEDALSFAAAWADVPDGATADCGDLVPGAGSFALRAERSREAPAGPDDRVRFTVFVAVRSGTSLPFASVARPSRLGEPAVFRGLPAGHLEITITPGDGALAVSTLSEDWDGLTEGREIVVELRPREERAQLDVTLPAREGSRTVFVIGGGSILGRFLTVPGKLSPLTFRMLPIAATGEVWVFEGGRCARVTFPPLRREESVA
ncbi:MAG: carboxypeptidase regulatory-like domain-containing protein, partial [Planctomycetota bacterium]